MPQGLHPLVNRDLAAGLTKAQILNHYKRGHVDANPAVGIEPNRRPRHTRFLSHKEIARLHAALDVEAGKGEGLRQQADIVRLLLLTGYRRGEIVNLRRSEVQGDALILVDSKTGPREVSLGTQARRILERQPRTDSLFVFPSPLDPSRPRGGELSLWYRVRKDVGIEDACLHDLRHTHASHAVMNGVPVPAVSQLLGHSSVRTTLRYAHLGDREIEAAAERVTASAMLAKSHVDHRQFDTVLLELAVGGVGVSDIPSTGDGDQCHDPPKIGCEAQEIRSFGNTVGRIQGFE